MVYNEIMEQEFERLMDVMLTDVTKHELETAGKYVFSVTKSYAIFVSKTSHEYLAKNYGATLDNIIADGTIAVDAERNIDIEFRPEIYHKFASFEGNEDQKQLMKLAVKNKIIEYIS